MAPSARTRLNLLGSAVTVSMLLVPIVSTAQVRPSPSVPVQIVAPVPVPITGTVNVSGAPNVITNTIPVPISGTVSIQGTPNVAVQNSALTPVYTKDAAQASRTPFKMTQVFRFQSDASSSDVFRLETPAGSRIHIESLYCRFGMPIGVVGISSVTGQMTKPAWEADFCRAGGSD